MRVSALRILQVPPGEVSRFLGDLENHRALSDEWLEVVELEADGAEVVVHGPLWIRRRARTRVHRRRPGLLAGTARDEAGTTARLTWTVDAEYPGTVVRSRRRSTAPAGSTGSCSRSAAAGGSDWPSCAPCASSSARWLRPGSAC